MKKLAFGLVVVISKLVEHNAKRMTCVGLITKYA